ncbi:MAG: glycoside hydrolase [Alistipes sp.]|nr:glycoside hydrolase [Alistipes sp.]
MRHLFHILVVLVAMCGVSCTSQPQIITTTEGIADGEWLCFHKEFVTLSPKSAELQIAADTKYWLWVNGNLVVREGGLKRGPNPTDSYCDVLKSVPNLKFGKNEVVVLVQYYGMDSFSHKFSPTAGIYFDLKSKLDHIVSNKSWRAIRYDAMWHAPNEHNLQGVRKYRLSSANVGYDARKALDFSKNIDVGEWPNAVAVDREKSGWGEFVERPIPFWRWSELLEYQTISRGNECITCTLPYNAQVTPYIKLRAKGGEKIKICTDDYWIGPARSHYAEYIAREGVQEFEMPNWINGHSVLYFVPEGVEVLELKYRESGYDADFVGSFESDSYFCNDLWKKAQRTLYVNMRDNYMDCPDRERAQWWGDVVIELGQAGYVFDQRAHLLSRKAIRELMMHQREDGTIASPVPGMYKCELPCQMLASVGYYGFYTYYMQTGDLETVAEVYDRVKRYVFDVWNPSNDELVPLRKGDWLWGDWGTNIDHEALQQCWYALALKGFIEMARVTGYDRDAICAAQSYDMLKYAFNKRYWNERLQQYRTPGYKEQPDDRVQAMAVLAGFVPEERYEAIRKFLKKHYQASTYMEKYVLEALCQMGYHRDALKRMERRFGNMVASEYSTLWEGWEYTGSRGMKYKSGNGTYNHAWSGGGLIILSQYIAGISPIEPAFKSFKVEPNMAMLRRIDCVVPTNFGEIKLSARRLGIFEITLTVPQGTTAQVVAPHGYSTVECNGEKAPQLTLTSGEYKILVE